MIRSIRIELLACLALLVFCSHSNAENVVVSPRHGTTGINKLIDDLSAGDTLMFRPGIYKGPFILNGVSGILNTPVVLLGSAEGAEPVIIDGRSEPGTDLFNNAFQLEDCSWIVIEGFTVRNCWTDIITAIDVSYLSVKRCDVIGGRRLLYAKERGSHHFLLEDCRWEQDIRVWTHSDGYTWEELHHGKHSHYNGSIFQGYGISGVFVLRNNQIRNTFNAFRTSPVAEGKMDLLASSNGDIYNNLIINTSDNVLEPEVHCHNLFFYHNQLINGHAFISVTEVAGGPIYLFGNTGLSEPDCEDGWAIYKISERERTMSKPFYIFNNSWYVDYNITGMRRGWWNDHIVHFNNAYFFEGIDTFGIHTSGPDSYYNHDCSSAVFPDFFAEKGFELEGIEADPLYRDPLANDFRLKASSPCLDRGQAYAGLISDYEGQAPDIGAYEENVPVMGPAFRFSMPAVEIPFVEHPRITRFKLADKTLVLWFSVPMDRDRMVQCDPVLNTDETSLPMRLDSVEEEGHCLRFVLPEKVDSSDGVVVQLGDWPTGVNGMKLTSWASAMEVSVDQ